MTNLRFGRKLKLPSTHAIKHQLLMMMLRDERNAIAAAGDASIATAPQDGPQPNAAP